MERLRVLQLFTSHLPPRCELEVHASTRLRIEASRGSHGRKGFPNNMSVSRDFGLFSKGNTSNFIDVSKIISAIPKTEILTVK